MKSLLIYSIFLIVFSFQQASAKDACLLVYGNSLPTTSKNIFLKFNPSFKVSATGNLNLKAIESTHRKLESTVNGISNFILGRALKLNEIEKVVKSFISDTSTDPYFIKLARAFKLELKINEQELMQKIPASGPLIIVANHPKNGSDGIVLAAAVSMVRNDVKIALTNMLENFPGLKENAILLNPYGGNEARRYNQVKIQEMDRHLENDHVLIIFPSGEVSSKVNLDDQFAFDRSWKLGVANLLAKNPRIQILPVYIPNLATQGFYKVKKIKPKSLSNFLSIIFHIREISNNIGQPIELIPGSLIDGKSLLEQFHGDKNTMIQHLRARTYMQLSKKQNIELRSLIADKILIKYLNKKNSFEVAETAFLKETPLDHEIEILVNSDLTLDQLSVLFLEAQGYRLDKSPLYQKYSAWF